MNRIIDKTNIYTLMNYSIPGCILAFEIYYIVPASFQNLLTNNTLVWIFLYILFSFLFGLFNDCVSEYILKVYENGTIVNIIKNVFQWGKSKYQKMSNQDYSQTWDQVAGKLHLNLDDEDESEMKKDAIDAEFETDSGKSEDVHEEETQEDLEDAIENGEENDNEDSDDFIEAIADSIDIEGRVYKKTADGKIDLYDYIQRYHLPEVLEGSSNKEIDEYVYLFLLNSSIHNRLSEYMASCSLIKDLCSLCVLSAGFILFMRISGLLIVRLIYKLLIMILLVLLGYIFYQEYLEADLKLKRFNLIWYLQLKEDPKYAKEMGFDSLFSNKRKNQD